MAKKAEKTRKQGTGFSKNPVIRGFQVAWLWFKDTAWVQVVLVVLLVFAVVLSIPYIVKALTPENNTAEENFKFIRNYRKKYDDINKRIKDTKTKYTVVFYYAEGDDASKNVSYYLRTLYFKKGSANYQENFMNSFVALDLDRTDTKNGKDFDITTKQKDVLADKYRNFYMSDIYNNPDAVYTDSHGNQKDLYTDKWEPKDDGTVDLPSNTWIVYENNGGNSLEATDPHWISKGFPGDLLNDKITVDFQDLFKASINFKTDPPIITNN